MRLSVAVTLFSAGMAQEAQDDVDRLSAQSCAG